MKHLINKIVLGTITVACASCTGNYLEINSNPYQPGDLTPDDYALASAMNNLAGCVISSDVNTTQFTDCLLGGPLGGYFADSKASGWANTISNFNPTDDWTNVLLMSDWTIPRLYTNLTQIENLSKASGTEHPYAIAKIIKVAAMHRVTDAYGAIPYTLIGKDGNITTPYDSQETIYRTFFDELTSAVATLKDSGYQLSKTADYVYEGDVTKWVKFANSLKLRLAMRIIYANPKLAKEQILSAVNPENGGIIESNEENAAWNYFATSSNPIYVATRYNSATDHECITGGDTHASADIICYMNGYSDPRTSKYFTPSEWKDQPYVGVRRSIELSTLGTSAHKYSGVNISESASLYWMNAAEVAFLRAEAKAVFQIEAGPKTAKDYYEDGVKLSFAQWGVEGAEEYLESTAVPQTYKDPLNKNSYNTPFSTITVKWNEGASAEEKQERIITQKWIANWMLGNEAWADYRRTGYPKLLPATDAGNKSLGVVDSNKGARRIKYPADEYVSNSQNVNDAVTKYLPSGDNMGSKVWWDCKK